MSGGAEYWRHDTVNAEWYFSYALQRMHPTTFIASGTRHSVAAENSLRSIDNKGFPVFVTKVHLRGPHKGEVTVVALYMRRLLWKAKDLAYKKFCKKAGIPFRSLHVPKMRTKEERDQVAKPLQNR